MLAVMIIWFWLMKSRIITKMTTTIQICQTYLDNDCGLGNVDGTDRGDLDSILLVYLAEVGDRRGDDRNIVFPRNLHHVIRCRKGNP